MCVNDHVLSLATGGTLWLPKTGTLQITDHTSKLHLYSRRLIDICVKHKAGTLLLINQHEKEAVAKEDEFLLRNWSYYGLKEKIAYKAKKVGITLIIE